MATPMLHSWLQLTFGEERGWRWAALSSEIGLFEWGEEKGKPEDRLELHGCSIENQTKKSIEVKTDKGKLVLKWATEGECSVWTEAIQRAARSERKEPPRPPPKPANLAASSNGRRSTSPGRVSEPQKTRRPAPALPVARKSADELRPATISLKIDTVPEPPIAELPRAPVSAPIPVRPRPISIGPPNPISTQPLLSPTSQPDEPVLLSGMSLKPITPPPPEHDRPASPLERGFRVLGQAAGHASDLLEDLLTHSPPPEPVTKQSNSDIYMKYVGRTVRIMSPHTAGKASELTVEAGDKVTVLMVTPSNWAKGANTETGNMGYFPLVCLAYTGDGDEESVLKEGDEERRKSMDQSGTG